MYVSEYRFQITLIFDKRRVVAALEEVSSRLQLRLHCTREFGGYLAHGFSQWLVGNLHEEMQVVGHPAIPVNARSILLDSTLDDAVEQTLVTCRDEKVLPMIAPKRYVIDPTFNVNPVWARHPCLQS
jgi:hypothetical protein